MAIFVGDIGTVITIDVGVDISSGSAYKIVYRKPSGATGVWTGSLSGTTAVTYTVLTGDFDEEGDWKFQAHVVLPAWEGYSATETVAISTPLDTVE